MTFHIFALIVESRRLEFCFVLSSIFVDVDDLYFYDEDLCYGSLNVAAGWGHKHNHVIMPL